MSATRQAAVVRMWPRGITVRRPRLGFLGLGWIGRARRRAMFMTAARMADDYDDLYAEIGAHHETLPRLGVCA